MAVVRALIAELRPRQWIKNFACFAGLIFSGRLFTPLYIGKAGLSFALFCVIASAAYILNDIRDRETDRLHARTARRPIASGELPLPVAFAALAVLLVAAGIGSLGLGLDCLVVLGIYVAVNVWYSLQLKHSPILDVMCIGLGFVLRVVHGAYAVEVLPTAWTLLCIFFLAIFLGFAKRKAELAELTDHPGPARAVLDVYSDRYLDLLLTMTATMTIISYALFTVASHKNPTLVVTVLPVTYCIAHYMLNVMIASKGSVPEETLLTDKALLAGILVWVVLCVVILYGDVHFIVERATWYHEKPGQ
jgi:4-hydroxybenzoate polyprenyltransferase